MTKRNKSLWIIILILNISLIGLFFVGSASAVDNVRFTPEIGIPNSEFQGGQEIELASEDTSYIGKYVKAIYNYGLGIAGILAAIVMMIGGYLWILSGGSAAGITKAKEMMTGAIVGLLILFFSWVLLNTINPDLINFKITDIGSIDKIAVSTYCSDENGPITVEVRDDKFFYKDTEKIMNEPGGECLSPSVCTRVNYKWQCIDKSGLTCCQYKKNNATGITCQTVLTIDGCPPVRNKNDLDKTYAGTACVAYNDGGRNPCVYEQ